jgi:hypothetical protein
MDAESSSSRIFKVHERGYGGYGAACGLTPLTLASLHAWCGTLRTEAVRVRVRLRLPVVAALRRGTGELDSKAGRAWE